ncbi:hypothetical protein QCA50_001156 [Cerrena zonata]|uniref:Uncharacterized protein n=1 Tax=Cerrena zonata TaxID=2478898 RepID=A0AAW0GZ42_9APHY
MEISPTDEHFPEYPPLPIVGATLDATRPGSDPPVIGAWPKSPIDLCSVSPPPFPRGSVDDNSSASSEDGAASHASSDEDTDEDNHEDNLDDDEVIVAEDKPAEASGSDEHLSSLPNVAEVEVAKDGIEEPIEKELESNTDEPMSDVNNAPSEGVAPAQDIVVDEVSVEEQVPTSEVAFPENPKSDDVETLKASVSAIAELRRKAEEDLAAIKAAHAEYEQTIAKMKVTSPSVGLFPPLYDSVSPHPVQTPSPMKRKRTIEFDEAEVCTIGVGSSELDLQLPPGVHAEVGRLVRVPQAAPPAKRRRVMRFMTAVAQTTAIATVGAVAAWSALAFT